MDAFELIAARFFEVQGYWTRVGVKVDLTKEERSRWTTGRCPPRDRRRRLETGEDELVIIECKSYLDSTGVRLEHLHGREDVEGDKFKLFNRAALRTTIVKALFRQLRGEGLIPNDDPTVKFVLIAGKILLGSRGVGPRPVRRSRVAAHPTFGACEGCSKVREARLRK